MTFSWTHLLPHTEFVGEDADDMGGGGGGKVFSMLNRTTVTYVDFL